MEVDLVFDFWRDGFRYKVKGMKFLELTSGDFHPGSTFTAKLQLDPDQEEELKDALEKGFSPTFFVRP